MPTMTRRQLLQTAGAGAAALALSPLAPFADAADKEKTGFTLPKLPYDYAALEPYIDAETMRIHHDKHHQAYVDNLNKALQGHEELLKKSVTSLLRDLKSLPKEIQTAVRNNGGGHANHTMFWLIMAKEGGKPSGELARAIDDAFGSLEKFQDKLNQAALTRFGSGWAWLVLDKGQLKVLSTANQNSPLLNGQTPIMGIDVWEHAYYLKYQNRRPEYVKAWWHVVNWDNISERYNKARKEA